MAWMRIPLVLTAMAGALGSLAIECGGSSSSPAPTITVDRATCEPGLTTLAVVDRPSATVSDLAAAADGTTFFLDEDGDPSFTGIFAVAPSGGTPRRISDFGLGLRVWVDGETLWIATADALYAMPLAGGKPTLVSQIPAPNATTTAATDLQVGAFAFDSASLYAMAKRTGGATLQIWRLPRAGGPPDLLFQSTDPAQRGTFLGPLAQDAEGLYFLENERTGAPPGPFVRLPKGGGTPAPVRSDIGWSPSMMVVQGASLYGDGMAVHSFTDSPLGRLALDGGGPPTRILGVGAGLVEAMVADDAGAFVAFRVGLESDRVAQPLAVAALPRGTEREVASGCTQISDAGFVGTATAMALDPTYAFALLQEFTSSPTAHDRYTIVRVLR
jgi:hypothetical protein